MEAMLQLGRFVFAPAGATFDELSRTRAFRWAAQERLGRRPARQFLGPGEESIAIQGRIYPHFRGGLGQIDAMAAEAGRGEPLELTDSRGETWGTWCIDRIEETRRELIAGGLPRRIDFTLNLSRYGDDEA